MQQLSGFDATFIYLEKPKQPLHIGGLFVYDQSELPTPVRFKEILDYASKRVHRSAVFRRKLLRVPLDIDHPYWIDDPDFDIEFHIRHIALPEPRDWRQLCIEACRLWARPLDLTRPLWEWWVIEGLDNVRGVPPGSFAIVMKLHHAAVDGKAGAAMVDVAHTLSPDEVVEPPDEAWTPAPVPRNMQLLGLAATNAIGLPMRMMETMTQMRELATATVARGYENSPFAAGGGVPVTRFGGPVSGRRVHGSIRVSLEDFRVIRSAVPGSTVNDCVIAIVGAAMRNYLAGHGEAPDKSLIAGVPISIRPDAQAAHGGNAVAFTVVSMATDVGSPLEQLAAISASTKAKKEFTHAVPAHVLSDMAHYLPGTLMMAASRMSVDAITRGRSLCNTIVSNVPGWQEPRYLAGARMVQYDGMAPVADSMGIIHPISSYLGEVAISFGADREMVPDPAVYDECLGEAKTRLLDAARAVTTQPKPKASRATGSSRRASTSSRSKTAKSGAKAKAKSGTTATRASRAGAAEKS